jgi:hypothetical protein
MVRDLLSKVQKQCKGLDVRVRWALVAYRDHGDADQLQVVPFEEKTDALAAKARAGAQGAGGPRRGLERWALLLGGSIA